MDSFHSFCRDLNVSLHEEGGYVSRRIYYQGHTSIDAASAERNRVILYDNMPWLIGSISKLQISSNVMANGDEDVSKPYDNQSISNVQFILSCA